MFDITLPSLEKLEKERLFDILSFKIKSSIFENIPTFILRVKSSNYMPDDMRLLIGSALVLLFIEAAQDLQSRVPFTLPSFLNLLP